LYLAAFILCCSPPHTGVHNNISLRLTNHDRSRRKIKPQNIIANMFTRRSHQSDFQFVTHSEYYGFDPDDPGHQ
jgi:hypothetical protein